MDIMKNKKYIVWIGIMLSIVGITLTKNASIGQTFIIFGCYWAGFGMALIYIESKKV